MPRYAYQPLWLSLYFPNLPIDRLGAHEQLCAIVDRQRIAFVSEAASAAGIKPDMRQATAVALQPTLQLVERRTEDEARALRALSEWCYQFTPTVMPYKYFSVVLEIGGSLSLFKGLTRLRQQIQQGLVRQGYHFSEGLAHSREGAWLMSRFRAGQDAALIPGNISEFVPPAADFWLPQLHTLPLYCLDLEAKQQKKLFNMGLRTVGELASLPRKELGRRFGKSMLALLASLLGEAPEPGVDFNPAATFSAQEDFANGLTRLEELATPMEDLLQQLLRFLYRQQWHARSLEWQFYYFREKADKVLLHISPANNNLQSLLSLSRLKLEPYVLKAPLESLCLYSDTFAPAAADSDELFPELSHPNNRWRDYRQLLDRLVTRLGDKGVSTMNLADEQLPEYRQRLRCLNGENIDALEAPPPFPEQAAMQTPLPLWLTEEALPIAAPDNQTGPLRLVYGPQRIDSHWWQNRSQRDYFIARHHNGSYCWVYQDLKNRRWYVQGFYG